jgi:putative acetyltransferase
MQIRIKQASRQDLPNLRELFLDTVLHVNIADYSLEQVQEWASRGESIDRWNKLFSEHQYWLCEHDEKVVGFISCNGSGLIHSLFVSKDFQRKGVAKLLFQTLEEYANQNNIRTLTAEVSITAKPFFESKGFIVEEEQIVQLNQCYLKNFKMRKNI